MGFLAPKGTSHIESRRWSDTHLGKQTQYHKQGIIIYGHKDKERYLINNIGT